MSTRYVGRWRRLEPSHIVEEGEDGLWLDCPHAWDYLWHMMSYGNRMYERFGPGEVVFLDTEEPGEVAYVVCAQWRGGGNSLPTLYVPDDFVGLLTQLQDWASDMEYTLTEVERK